MRMQRNHSCRGPYTWPRMRHGPVPTLVGQLLQGTRRLHWHKNRVPCTQRDFIFRSGQLTVSIKRQKWHQTDMYTTNIVSSRCANATCRCMVVLQGTKPRAELKAWSTLCDTADSRAGRVDIERKHTALEKNLCFVALRLCAYPVGAISTHVVWRHILAILRECQHVLGILATRRGVRCYHAVCSRLGYVCRPTPCRRAVVVPAEKVFLKTVGSWSHFSTLAIFSTKEIVANENLPNVCHVPGLCMCVVEIIRFEKTKTQSATTVNTSKALQW